MVTNTASNTRRTAVVYSLDEACTYLKAASAFNSQVYIKKGENFNLLVDNCISQVDVKGDSFIFKKKLELAGLSQGKCAFRILLEACVIDFTSTLQTADQGDGKQRFLIPRKMNIQYIRKYLRIKPSKYHPVQIRIKRDRLTLKFTVLDISTSGVAVKVPRAELLFGIGDMIDEMELQLTEQNLIRVSGQIRFVKGERCGIKFINSTDESKQLIAEYIDRRQLAEKIRAKTYRDVEKELMMLNKKGQVSG